MYKILDLFAGAGGLSLGFEMTGQFEVAAIVENNKNAARTYLENHSGLKNYNDILKVDFKQILEENGKIDVVIGGPPCQGFSNANRQRRQLINGSNELVKRYVKAIEELKPQVFVMENVKTIASDKHSFCVTHGDERHIIDTLGLKIHNKDVVLYEGENVHRISKVCQQHPITELSLLNEEELYLVYNLYKKRMKLRKYFEKLSNIKKVQDVLKSMEEKIGLPEWYNESTLAAKEVLQQLVDSHGVVDVGKLDVVKEFWNIQRFFQGILELDMKDAIYKTIVENNTIIVRMNTYIVIEYIKASFKYLGYTINGDVLNAATFGVPQTRERYILIGVKDKKKKVELPEPIIKDPKEYITVKQAIEDLSKYEPTKGSMDEIQTRKNMPSINSYYRKIILRDADEKIFNHVCTDTREVALKRFEMIKQGENFHSLPDDLKHTYENPGRTQNTIYKRLDYGSPSDTVVNVRKSMWIHPKLNRAISAREAARLQGFPDNYRFYGTKDSVYQQIGNAVPPILGRAVAEKVLELLQCNVNYEKIKQLYISTK